MGINKASIHLTLTVCGLLILCCQGAPHSTSSPPSRELLAINSVAKDQKVLAGVSRGMGIVKASVPRMDPLNGGAPVEPEFDPMSIPYLASVGLMASVGLGIAVLSFCGGFWFGAYRLFSCMGSGSASCCGDSDNIMVPGALFLFTATLTGFSSYIGFSHNPTLSVGFTDLTGACIGMGTDAFGLTEGLSLGISNITSAVPVSLNNISLQLDGLDVLSAKLHGLKSEVVGISNATNTTFLSIENIRNASLVPELIALQNDLGSMRNDSAKMMDGLNDMIHQIDDQLAAMKNQSDDAMSNSERVEEQGEDIDKQITDVSDRINGVSTMISTYGDMFLYYDGYRLLAFQGIYAIALFTTVVGLAGLLLKHHLPEKGTVWCAFLSMFLMGLALAVHLPLGVLLGDACGTEGLVSTARTQAAQFGSSMGDVAFDMMEDCREQTVFEIMNVQSMNLSDSVDFASLLSDYDNFTSNFNWSLYESYLADGVNLKHEHNLTLTIASLSVNDTVGFDETSIEDKLDELEVETLDYWSSSNYTSCVPGSYGDPVAVQLLMDQLDVLMDANTTAYDIVQNLEADLGQVWISIQDISSNCTSTNVTMYAFRDEMSVFRANVSLIEVVVDMFQVTIDTLFEESGDCSFFPMRVEAVDTAVCTTVLHAVDTLAFTQLLTAVGFIPGIIAASLLWRIFWRRGQGIMEPEMDEEDFMEEEEEDRLRRRRGNRRVAPAPLSMQESLSLMEVAPASMEGEIVEEEEAPPVKKKKKKKKRKKKKKKVGVVEGEELGEEEYEDGEPISDFFVTSAVVHAEKHWRKKTKKRKEERDKGF